MILIIFYIICLLQKDGDFKICWFYFILIVYSTTIPINYLILFKEYIDFLPSYLLIRID